MPSLFMQNKLIFMVFLVFIKKYAHLKSFILYLQLQMYKERYEEFQSTISKSEEMFQKFKTEMEKV